MPFSAEAVSSLKAMVDAACADPLTDIPGAVVVMVNRAGEELLAHAAGVRGVSGAADGKREPMTLDTVFWIASCTKLLAGIACMQLVERGVLRLDDGDQIEELCPELARLKVLGKDGVLVDKTNKISLRMLLSHTAGFGYTFFNERLRDWALPTGVDEFSGRREDVLLPLLFQPGEGWEYGVGIDWAGIALERVTGLKLNDYLQQNVFQPLGIKDMAMVPGDDMRSRLAYMHHREADGKLRARDHLLRAPLVIDIDNKTDMARLHNSGGAGLFATVQEYCKVLATILNDGKSPTTGAQILRPDTIAEMFKNQIPHLPDFARQGIPAAKPDLTNPIAEIYPVEGRPPQGWGLTFLQPIGAEAGTVCWAGLPNLWWWLNREKGIAGLVATQILPFVDPKVMALWFGVQGASYAALG
ncbi:hypothetical protein PgNI_05304 [Pyricularia grisea]|uniref:Beta-lactamase-related domain-containing protein n=1 Tax=Pyricularia grisea TaxID=148305 RepID=A0A6P8B854_PYRGI|nr:hypothetical protein PgNI_05304 [Pyricularia grisea]TLD11423.1 hypothetical protein PgNI_05304 [Pyricularia grisea]